MDHNCVDNTGELQVSHIGGKVGGRVGGLSPPPQPTLKIGGRASLLQLQCYYYSKTSDSGPSDIGTVYNRPLYKGHCLWSQIFTLPIVLVHLQPPRRGQPLYKGQNT